MKLKKVRKLLCYTLLLSVSCTTFAQSTTENSFKAQGFADSTGGTGGKIIYVTNLNGSGSGSLRDALNVKGARIVVFEVGGVIDLKKKALSVSEPFLTIAGETAPSPGITIIRGPISVKTHDVVIRHIRVRPGDAHFSKKSGWEVDGLSTSGSDAYNIIIDHCSFSWATDENLSASGERTKGPEATSRRVTFSNCIIAEGLNDSTHAKGEHSKGSLIHDFCRDIAVIGNLYAHNKDRNPYFKAFTTGVIVNNLIYNPGSAAIKLNYSDKEWRESHYKPENCRVSIEGNVMVHGANTTKNLALAVGRGDAFLNDNRCFDRKGNEAPQISGSINTLGERPVWPQGLQPLPSDKVTEYVLNNAGARPLDRDATDARIVSEVRERKGQIINSQEEVGGYPEQQMTNQNLNLSKDNLETMLEQMARELLP